MGLYILQWNSNGLYLHKAELQRFITSSTRTPDIICVQETHLNENIKTHLNEMPDYNHHAGL